MNVAELLEKRRPDWLELEDRLSQIKRFFGSSRLNGADIARFTALYRAVCADLALAESYRLPAGIVRYLNNLVGRAHNQLYRDQSIGWWSLPRMILGELPRRIFGCGAIWAGMALFFIPFFVCMYWAAKDPEFAPLVVGADYLESMEEMYDTPFSEMDPNERLGSVGFYIINNAGIGLSCFAAGAFFMIGGIIVTSKNAILLGTIFGHMSTQPQSVTFYEFVTAHGPLELTAIAMAAGAGLHIGMAMISTGGLKRIDSIQKAAVYVAPIALFSVFLFFCAAIIEALISPNPMPLLQDIGVSPIMVKRTVAMTTGLLLFAYIILLGGFQWIKEKSRKNETPYQLPK